MMLATILSFPMPFCAEYGNLGALSSTLLCEVSPRKTFSLQYTSRSYSLRINKDPLANGAEALTQCFHS
jgi:hypothetical protein